MKARILILCTLVLSSSALASLPPSPLLVRTQNGGAINPRNQWTSTCTLFPNVVLTRSRGSMMDPTPIKKQVKYTAQIKDDNAVRALIKVASKTKLSAPIPGPVGGTSTKHQSIQTQNSGAPITSDLRIQNGVIVVNESPAAIALVRFLDSNCDQ